MKVWLGYDVHFDGGMGITRHLEKVFDCEVKAFLWVEEKANNGNYHPDYEWRESEEKEVE